MRVVIDASIDPRLVEAFAGEDVQTLFDLGWQHLKDNVLVKQLDCDVFVTADRGFEHNLKSLRLNAIATVRAGQEVHVSGPAGGEQDSERGS